MLFGLSYNTMPHHLIVLHQALKQLRPGGRVVIMDGKVPSGMGGKFILPFGLWLMRHTMLGNPLIKPWQDLAAVTDNFEMEQFLFGSWYVCWGTKSARSTDGCAPVRDRTADRGRVIRTRLTRTAERFSSASIETAAASPISGHSWCRSCRNRARDRACPRPRMD